MSREAKIFSVNYKEEVGKRIKEYESFGWELLSINDLDISMSRETQNKVYVELVKYEYEYELLNNKIDEMERPVRPYPFNLGSAVLGLLILVLPGLLYILHKIQENKDYQASMDQYNFEKEQIEKKIKEVCNTARATFFARQSV